MVSFEKSFLSLFLIMSKNTVNILAERYASKEMNQIWGAEGRILLERDYWIAVVKAQKSLGIDIPAEAIEAYESVKDQVNLQSIQQREAVTRHDVKARIEEFCALAGHEHIHKGLTSRDLTENVEQLQILRGLELIRIKAMASLIKLAEKAEEWSQLVLTARTHNVPAQLTTLESVCNVWGRFILCSS